MPPSAHKSGEDHLNLFISMIMAKIWYFFIWNVSVKEALAHLHYRSKLVHCKEQKKKYFAVVKHANLAKFLPQCKHRFELYLHW